MAECRAESFFKELNQRMPELTSILAEQSSTCGYPVYTSMDIRDAGWKVCAVDVNIFPAGFNQLDNEDRLRASLRMSQFLSAKLLKTSPWKLTLIPEAHTNNLGYLENLVGLIGILKNAGAEVKLAWSGQPIPKAWTLKSPSGQDLVYLPIQEALEGSDCVILNHDLSGGLPSYLQNIKIPVYPSPKLGWYRRRKSEHFEIVSGLLKVLQKKLPFFDPWYFGAHATTVSSINFDLDADRERIAETASEIYKKLELDYQKRNIPQSPSLFIKNNSGTYGMGVIAIQSPKDILELSKSDKNKMRKGKESVPISEVIIQEAIPTALHYQDSQKNTVAGEPVLYMVDGLPVGGFLRLHEKLGPRAMWENLNQPGGKLEALGRMSTENCNYHFPKLRGLCPREEIEGKSVYYFLSKLHATAAGLEECPR